MPRPKSILPKLTRHKAKARGVIRLNGKDHYLGPCSPFAPPSASVATVTTIGVVFEVSTASPPWPN